MNDLKRYQLEEFHKILPGLEMLLSKVTLTNKATRYCVDGFKFLACKNDLRIGFGLTHERSIFPTVEYELLDDRSVRLLQFRIDQNSLHHPYIFQN